MALVVFLRGVNVGGHKTFRPKLLAERLRHLDAVNIGAAGTFVIRKPVALNQLRAAIAKLLPFETMIVICRGADIERLLAARAYADPPPAGITRFVSVLPDKRPRAKVMRLPATGRWLVRILGQHERFVVGEYRRDLHTIRYLGNLDDLVSVPVTTRNWNTINAIAKILRA